MTKKKRHPFVKSKKAAGQLAHPLEPMNSQERAELKLLLRQQDKMLRILRDFNFENAPVFRFSRTGRHE
jgi:hypothetical protein